MGERRSWWNQQRGKESLPDLFFPMGSLKKRRKSVSRGMGQLGCWPIDKPTQESTAVLALVGPLTSLNQLTSPWVTWGITHLANCPSLPSLCLVI